MSKIKNVLIIKTSSLGDVIHTLPAVTDAHSHYPDIKFDWVVEEAFQEIPSWHPAINRVIPVSIRRWRKNPWQAQKTGEWQQFRQALTEIDYDYVIDAQGLLKSSWITAQANGIRCGLDYQSAREPLASLLYQQRYNIEKEQHAVTRVRELFAKVLNYTIPAEFPDYHIQPYFAQMSAITQSPYVVFLHGTTWDSKHWVESYWIDLAVKLANDGYEVHLPWGNNNEYKRAEKIAAFHANIVILPKMNLADIANELAHAQVVVGVDTGLAHLAAALDTPAVTLYGATEPAWTGTFGHHQIHLQAGLACSPCLNKKCTYHSAIDNYPACFQDLSVEKVSTAIDSLLISN